MGIGAESTEGKVVRIEEWRDADRTTYTTVATYTVDGHTYRCEYNAQHDLWTYYQVGDRVQIFYQVDDPSSAVFDSSLSRLFSILFIALGFILGTYFIRILVRHIRNIRAAARKKSPSG